MPKSVIIPVPPLACAATGGIHTPTMSPCLPITPAEIAEAADGARERLALKGADNVKFQTVNLA
jgi:uncharacterized protein (DUF849 family)